MVILTTCILNSKNISCMIIRHVIVQITFSLRDDTRYKSECRLDTKKRNTFFSFPFHVSPSFFRGHSLSKISTEKENGNHFSSTKKLVWRQSIEHLLKVSILLLLSLSLSLYVVAPSSSIHFVHREHEKEGKKKKLFPVP